MATNEEKLRKARLKARRSPSKVEFVESSDIYKQLETIYEVVNKSLEGNKSISKETATNLIELSNNISVLKELIATGIKVTNLDDIKQAEEIFVKNLSDISSEVTVKNPTQIPDWLATDKSIGKVNDSIQTVITKLIELAATKPGQNPTDYIPYRRVRKNGNKLEFDDNYWGPVAGGGGGGTGTGLLPFAFVDIQFTNADANGNYQTWTVTKEDGSTAMVSATYDGNSNVTGLTRSG